MIYFTAFRSAFGKLTIAGLMLLVSILLTNCGRAVVFGTLAQKPVNSGPMQLYIDRDGSLYPSNGPGITDAVLGAKGTGQGYLLRYYKNHPSDLTNLYDVHGITPPTDMLEAWPALQFKLRQEAASKINKQLDQLGAKSTLVVLIHGFNNTPEEAKDSFTEVEKQLRVNGLPNGPYQVLEVYWDGRSGAVPFFFLYAQPNAQLVGLALRGVVNQISHAHPIRILTHSLGTLVGCNTLWNVTSTMGGQVASVKDSNLKFWQDLTTIDAAGNDVARFYYQQACKDAVNYSTPTHPDIRIGSVAAAVPGQTYDDYLDRTPARADNDGQYRRVVIGYNPTDKVLNKFWIFAPLHRRLGITTLGRRNYDYHHYVAPMLSTKSTGGQSFQARFYRCKKKGMFNHSFNGYAKSTEMPYFLNLLLSDNPPAAPPACP